MGIRSKKIWSYLISCAITIGFLLAIASLIDSILPQKNITVFKMGVIISAICGIISITNIYARLLRSSPNPIPFISINIPNFLYDKHFEDEIKLFDKQLIEENKNYKNYAIELESTLDLYIDELDKKDRELETESYITDIYIRHHQNTSRLVRSLLQLMEENKRNWKWEFCNNVLDECVTVLEKDRADKSSSVYFINEKRELEMFAYNRIEFWSSRNRKFKKDEGFAGNVWSYKDKVLINDISKSKFFTEEFKPKHEYGSILGVPIMIGDNVVGVLCIQSEDKNGFTQDDERTVKFYADMCALAHFYDTLITQQIREGDLIGSN